MSDQVPADGPEGTRLIAQPSREELPVPIIPDHQLLRRIGQGSYGEVWLARSAMGAYRAVKVVYRRSFADHRPFEREMSGIRKFEPVSRSHEGFIDILQVGLNEQDGYFYYVMELGDDQDSGASIDPDHYSPKTLAKQIAARQRLSFQECLRLGLALSQAVGELHKRGLVHRDIKPSNIIFANGVPKLADIGLVADVHEAASYVGTQGFIPPEGPGTPQADVYSLGKVLYEASTGKDRQDFPELPADWDRGPDALGYQELNEVIVQACRAEVAQRYASAQDMYADLIVLENGKSVKRLKLLERRLSALKHLAGISAVVLLVVAVIGREIYREWQTAVYARQQQVGGNIANGNHAVDEGDLAGALPFFAEGLRLDKGREAEHRLRFGSIHAQCPKLVQMWFAGTEVDDVRFSPDGRSILAIEGHGQAQVLDIETASPASPRFGQKQTLWAGDFSPDGRLVVTASEDGTACLWRVDDGTRYCELPHPQAVLSACFSPDGQHVLTSCVDGIARIWNAETGLLENELIGHKEPLVFAGYSRDGRLIVTSGRDATAQVWDAATGTKIGPPLVHRNWVSFADFSPDNQQLVTACADHKAHIWDFRNGRQLLPELRHNDVVNSVCYSPDGRLILTACLDDTARLWNAETQLPLTANHVLNHSARVTHASFSSDSHRVVTSCVDGTVRVWDLAGASVPPKPVVHTFCEDMSRFLTVNGQEVQVSDTASGQPVGPTIRAAFPIGATRTSRNGSFVAVLSVNMQPDKPTIAQVFNVLTGKPVGATIVLSNQPGAVYISNDGTRLLRSTVELVETWNLVTGSMLAQFKWPEPGLQNCAFSPNSRAAVAWSTNGWFEVWDTMSGRAYFRPTKQSRPVSYADFSPDSSRVVTCGADNGFNACWAQVWEVATGKPLGPPLRHKDGVLFAAFDPSGTRLATGGEGFVAELWDAATGHPLTGPLKHQEQVEMCVFSSDGTELVTASADRTARVWSTASGDPLTPPFRHPASISSARFLNDGRHIITSDDTGTAWTWDLLTDERPAEDLVDLARLLTGDRITTSGALKRSDSLATVWQRLRRKYPADFTVSRQETTAWHQLQAQESETQERWDSVLFHLQALAHLAEVGADIPWRATPARSHLAGGQ